jgi:hypothetical protein
MAKKGLSFAEMNSMFALREFLNPDDYTIVITVDIDDCPTATIPLAELFDFTSFTVVEDYHKILGGYVKQQLELTAWLNKQSSARLLSARFATYKLRDTGELVSIRKPALQQMIVRAIQSYNDNQDRLSVPILVAFMVPACSLPRRPGTKTVVATVPHMRCSVMRPTSQPYVGKTLTFQSTTREVVDIGLGSSKTLVIEECPLPMYHGGTRSQQDCRLDIMDYNRDRAVATFVGATSKAAAKDTDIRRVDSYIEAFIGRARKFILEGSEDDDRLNATLENNLSTLQQRSNDNVVTTADSMEDILFPMLPVGTDIVTCGSAESITSNTLMDECHLTDCSHCLLSFDSNRLRLSALMQYKPVDRGRFLRICQDIITFILATIWLWCRLSPVSTFRGILGLFGLSLQRLLRNDDFHQEYSISSACSGFGNRQRHVSIYTARGLHCYLRPLGIIHYQFAGMQGLYDIDLSQ